MKDIADTYKGTSLTDLVNGCNAGNIQSLYLNGNFNEIEAGTSSERRAGTCEGNPHKLYNKKSKLGKYNQTIAMNEKVSQSSSKEEIKAL